MTAVSWSAVRWAERPLRCRGVRRLADFAVVIHGVVLDPDYAPFRGSLLRAQAGWPMLLLPVAHLFLVSVLVWIAGRVKFQGGALIKGVKLGVVGWCAGQAPLWLLWYAEQPWPGELVIKQLVLELISSMILGVTISAVVSQPQAGPSAASAV